MFHSKHIEPSKSFGIINSITKLHLVGISTESNLGRSVIDIFGGQTIKVSEDYWPVYES
jgi:hypothetical protein